MIIDLTSVDLQIDTNTLQFIVEKEWVHLVDMPQDKFKDITVGDAKSLMDLVDQTDKQTRQFVYSTLSIL